MTEHFSDPRLRALNADSGFEDEGMRRALVEALEPDEAAVASYSVSAHIWVQAVLTDRALLLVKGALRVKVIRVPLPLEILRAPSGNRTGARVRTPLGTKTLWGSTLDPHGGWLLSASTLSTPSGPPPAAPVAASTGTVATVSTRLTLRQARRAAGPRPRKPRPSRVRRARVGFEPPATVWEMADNCIKCGRPLTDPRSRRARVGTRCITVFGSQERRVPNPAHAVWRARKAKADAAYIADKAQAEAEFTRAMAAYQQAHAEWRRIRSRR
jgi:hypothetical protein